MRQCQPPGPQCHRHAFPAAVLSISQQRQLAGGKLHPDLMGAPGEQPHLYQHGGLPLLQHPIGQLGGLCALSLPIHHIGAVFHPIVKQDILQLPCLRRRHPRQQCQIFFVQPVFLHRLGQRRSSLLCAGKHHHAAGVLIQPMHRINAAKGRLQFGHSAFAALTVRLRQQSRRLDAHHHVGILI